MSQIGGNAGPGKRPEYLPFYEEFRSQSRNLVMQANMMAETAEHYGGTKVGGVAQIAYGDGVRLITYGANTKKSITHRKDCAEKKFFSELDEINSEHPDSPAIIEAMVIVGPDRPDDVSRLYPPTLHSCGLCREDMAGYIAQAHTVQPDSILLFANPDKSFYEIYTVSELLQIHDLAMHGIVPQLLPYRDLDSALSGFEERRPDVAFGRY